MSIYVIPEGIDNKDLTDTLARFGAPLIRPARLREFILETQGLPVAVATLSVPDLMVLNRHAKTLLDEVPTVVLSIPGALYTAEWMTIASALPAIDWIELEKKLTKSGHTANNVDQLTERGKGTETLGNVRREGDLSKTSGFFSRRHQTLPKSPLDGSLEERDRAPELAEDDQ